MNRNFTLRIPLIFGLILSTALMAGAQDNVGIGTTTPHPNALLEIQSSDKGVLIPRMTTTERLAILPTASANGLLVYDTSDLQFWYWDGTQWVQALGPMGPIGPTGLNGMDGLNGQDGLNGATGAIGPTGADGQDGADGATGAIGPTGADGQDGANGATGAIGPTGADGQDGANGATGAIGPTGSDGQDGVDGTDGAIGPTGPAGPVNQVAAFAQGSDDWSTGTNGAWVNTDTQVTLTTHGNDVFISATMSPWVWADFIGYRIMRDGATFISGGYMDCYSIVEEDGRYTFTVTGMDVTPAAGSHTYTVQTAISDGGTNTFIVESYISALEINE